MLNDNKGGQQAFTDLLGKGGHALLAAGNADACLALLQEQPVDVVLLDMETPGIDGVAMTRQIRALPDKAHADIPVIALTDNVAREDIMTYLEAGMTDYCAKPVSADKINAILSRITKRSSAAAKVTASIPVTAPQPRIPIPDINKSDTIERAEIHPHGEPVPAPEAAPAPAAPAARVEPDMSALDTEALGVLKSSLGVEQMAGLMKDFYDKADQLLDEADKAVAAKSVKALTSIGHDLAGMASNFGFTKLGGIGREIQNLGRGDASADAITPKVAQLRACYAASRAAADQFLKE